MKRRLRSCSSTSIERLETRIAPATITGSVVGGVLKLVPLTPTTAVNAFLVQIDSDSFQIYENGAFGALFDGVHSVKATFGDQADTFSIAFLSGAFRGPVSIASGNGADTLNFQGNGGALVGDVSIVSKGAAHIREDPASILRGATSITAPGGIVEISGKLGSLATTGVSQVLLHTGSDIAGNVRITSPDTGVVLTADGTIEGDLSVLGSKSPAAPDFVHLNGSTHGKVALVFGEGGSSTDSTAGFFIGGPLSISGKSGTDLVSLALGNNTPFATIISGPVKLALGDGPNSVSITGTGRIGGGLRTMGGTGTDSVALNGAFMVGGLTRFDLGANNNSVQVTATIFAGGLTIGGGADNDSLMFTQASVLGAAKLSLGDGTNMTTFNIGTLENGLTLKGGAGSDTVAFGGTTSRGKTMLALGDGTNSVTATVATFRTNFTYLGGKTGSNWVNIDPGSTLSGSFTMIAGDGNNTLILNTLSSLSTLTYKGGANGDFVALSEGGGSFVRGKIDLGAGTDSAVVRNSNFVSLSLDGGLGSDTIGHLAAALAAGPVEKNFEVTSIIP